MATTIAGIIAAQASGQIEFADRVQPVAADHHEGGHEHGGRHRPCDLAAQNRQLVSEHHDFKLLELTRAKTQRRHRKSTPRQQIHR